MKRKMLSLLLAGAMSVSVLAGCNGGSPAPDTGKTDESKSDVETEAEGPDVQDNLDEAQDISVWLFKDDYKVYDSYSQNPVVQYLNEKFNCTLDFQQPAMGSEQEQFSLMIGTGQYTDVMEVTYSQESVAALYDEGVIMDLAPYLEKNMPNFYAFLNDPENEDVKRALYDNDGHLFTIPYQVRTEEENRWGGLVYRKDILETMTGGNVAFPSGNDTPTTISDWDYMLPLMKTYFEATGMPDTACVIIPAEGFFQSGELLTGFGIGGDFYVEDGTVKFGPTSEGFYHYLVKMKEWYDAGYIYKDFASRTTDQFYLPNTALTYGGAAGVWFGLGSQLDDAMSMPDYGLFVDVQALSSPLDTDTTSELLACTSLEDERAKMNSQGYVISTSCSEEKMLRFMTVADYLFTEEGAMLRTYGLTKDQGASDNEYYAAAGIGDGAYTMDGDTFTYADAMMPGTGSIVLDGAETAYLGSRLPGILNNRYSNQYASEASVRASAKWKGTGTANNYSSSILFTTEEAENKANLYTNYHDYLVTMVPKFIMGTEPLTEESFADFVNQMNSLGVEECMEINQTEYDAFMSR